jgi:hypothetical protein
VLPTSIIKAARDAATDRNHEHKYPTPGRLRGRLSEMRVGELMGHWGVNSYENDDAADALDAAFERVHGEAYDRLMDDRNAMSFDQVQKSLANPETLAAAVEELREAFGPDRDFDDWDETERLAFAGVVVRHAEFGVPVPPDWAGRALGWLENEAIDWDEPTVRNLRRQKEIRLLRGLVPGDLNAERGGS